jgi:hypothetical protein
MEGDPSIRHLTQEDDTHTKEQAIEQHDDSDNQTTMHQGGMKSEDWLEGAQLHRLQQQRRAASRQKGGRHSKIGRGTGSRQGKARATNAKLESGIDHLEPKQAPLLDEVRVNTTVGTKVREDKGYRERLQEVTRIEEVQHTKDSLSFLRGESLVEGLKTWAWVMVDGGSDIEAVSGEIVRQMGLGRKLRARKPEDRQRVRGVGTAEGAGEVITHDVWMSITVPGKRLTGWGVNMQPLEGEDTKLVIEGWWAVIEEMGMPIILGGQTLEQYDIMSRKHFNKIVLADGKGVQYSHTDTPRIVLDGNSMARMIATAKLEHHWDPIYDTNLWAELARGAFVAKVTHKSYNTDKIKILPNELTTVGSNYDITIGPHGGTGTKQGRSSQGEGPWSVGHRPR